MSEPFIGEIRMFGGNFAPAGWAFCNGQLMPISENETLFNLIGTTYGGDGQNDFALPNLQSRVPVHMGPINPIAAAAGEESVTLTTSQIPTHSHAFLATTTLASEGTPAGNTIAQSGTFQWFRGVLPASVQFAAGAITPDGGSQPHDNMIPFLCVSYIISLFGIFPSPT